MAFAGNLNSKFTCGNPFQTMKSSPLLQSLICGKQKDDYMFMSCYSARFAVKRSQVIRVSKESDDELSYFADMPKRSKPAIRKPRMGVKVVWGEKRVGVGVEQVIPNYGSVPMSAYFLWPKQDAWEEVKTLLESKSWISRKATVVLLNQITDLINLWQHHTTSSNPTF